MKMSKRKMTS